MTAILIQARMSSRRLPGKVLKEINGKKVLLRVIERCRLSRNASRVIVLTSDQHDDDLIEDYCLKNEVECFRGSRDDVLSRFYFAVQHYGLDGCVRITADCPMLDPSIVDCVILGAVSNNFDYFGLSGEFPDGLDCTYFSKKALLTSHKFASENYQREHIGQYIERNLDQFKCGTFELFWSHNDIRITLDEEVDLIFLSKLLRILENTKQNFTTVDIIKTLEQNPELKGINNTVVRNEGLNISRMIK